MKTLEVLEVIQSAIKLSLLQQTEVTLPLNFSKKEIVEILKVLSDNYTEKYYSGYADTSRESGDCQITH